MTLGHSCGATVGACSTTSSAPVHCEMPRFAFAERQFLESPQLNVVTGGFEPEIRFSVLPSTQSYHRRDSLARSGKAGRPGSERQCVTRSARSRC
jgi:hypothetical protein